MKKLTNLWFQLTGFTCNLKCRHCYISCSPTNKSKNHLNLKKIITAINETKTEDIKEIYLTGGEPLLHREINGIIRHCIKYGHVNILTNGILINDKKARFLRQLDMDSNNEIIVRISLDHYKEQKNDEIRGRGNFRKALSGINHLVNSGFNPVISAVNLWDEDETELREGFFDLLSQFKFEPSEINLKIIPPLKSGEYSKNYAKYNENEFVTYENFDKCKPENFDCSNSRIVTDSGVYACPALVNDPRGRTGDTLVDSSKKFFLELNACSVCQHSGRKIFSNEWEL